MHQGKLWITALEPVEFFRDYSEFLPMCCAMPCPRLDRIHLAAGGFP
jgi:hypothetical protein